MAKKTLPPSSEPAPAELEAVVAKLTAQIAELNAQRAALKAQARGKTVRHRTRDRLTVRKIETLKIPGFYADGGCLYLDFKDPPSKNWVMRYTRNGDTHDFGLGSYPDVSLAAARLARDTTLVKLRAGIDPVEERRQARLAPKLERAKAMTFRQCAEAYIAAHDASWKNRRHAAQWPSTLEAHVYPIFAAVAVAAIDTAMVLKVLEPSWHSRTETMSRVRGRIEAVLDWAKTRGYRTGENPARWRGHLENLLPKKSKIAPVKNHEALPYAELPGFMAELTGQTAIGALALQLAIFTVARTGETLGAKWDEIDLAGKLWTIPSSRMKGGREHRVPLSEPALDILATLGKLPPSPFLFPTDNPHKPVSTIIMLQMLRRMGRSGLTVHGFRSTFSDWCAERTGFPSEVREMALAHKINSAVEAAYRRGDLFEKRRELMKQWAAYATGPAPAGEVVPFIGGAAAS
jgi:integrase